MNDRVRFEDRGRPRAEVMSDLAHMRDNDIDWRGGRTAAYVFSAGEEIRALGKEAYNEYFTENALGARRAFPSVQRMEREVVAMGLDLFKAPEGAGGNMTTGGTESIVMAVKTCRDFTRKERGAWDFRGNIVLPDSAHPAFEKAAALMDLSVRRVPLAADYTADPAAMAEAIDADTMLMVGSAPCFSYGVIDPIEALSAIALERGVWLHVDACVGGWIAPFVADLGRPIPSFDFSNEGVKSISADLHKFGFCPKPASTIFFRDEKLRACQEFVFDAWPSGRFATHTLVGTRPAGAVAAAWAVLRHLGRDGYRRIAGEVMALRDAYLDGLAAIPHMQVRGRPALANIAFGCDDVDMGQVAALMSERGWLPGLLKTPPSLHLMLSLHHAKAREIYLADVADCVARVRDGTTRARSITANYS
jgi:glutamate/tyrosine decarboxylase-like PLP-dependent enzyme